MVLSVMIEVIAIGVLVSLSLLTLGISVDTVLFRDRAPVTLADLIELDYDLSECEPAPQELETSVRRATSTEPPRLSEAALRELSQEIQSLDIHEVDFDLSGMSEQPVTH